MHLFELGTILITLNNPHERASLAVQTLNAAYRTAIQL